MKKLIAFFENWKMKRKLRKFEEDFDMYFNGLLLGELYGMKVKLLTHMRQRKEQYLKKYLENGQSVESQMNEFLDSLKPTTK